MFVIYLRDPPPLDAGTELVEMRLITNSNAPGTGATVKTGRNDDLGPLGQADGHREFQVERI